MMGEMNEPHASRPYMPGYGVVPGDEGTGLLPWEWAERRLTSSRNYWVISLWPDGRPHAMPVWAVWDGRYLWFSSGGRSRKTRNLLADSRCVVAVEDATDPLVVEGSAEVVRENDALVAVLALVNAKYSTHYTMELMDPATNSTFRVRPGWAFGLVGDDFAGSPTRWIFDEDV